MLKTVAKDGDYLPAVPPGISPEDKSTTYVAVGKWESGDSKYTLWTHHLSSNFGIAVFGSGKQGGKLLLHQVLGDTKSLNTNLKAIHAEVTANPTKFKSAVVMIISPDAQTTAIIKGKDRRYMVSEMNSFFDKVEKFFKTKSRSKQYPFVFDIQHDVVEAALVADYKGTNGEVVLDSLNKLWIDGDGTRYWPSNGAGEPIKVKGT